MLKKILLVCAVILVIAGSIGWHYRPQLLDLMCGTTPAAPTEQLEEALRNGAIIVDVRMYVETRKEGADLVPGAENIPLLRLTSHLGELPHDKTIITFCMSGKRAGKAADILNARGFRALSGGGIANVKRVLAETQNG